MNKQNSNFLNRRKTGFLTLTLVCLSGILLSAQVTTLKTYVDSDATHYYDTQVPSGYRYIYLEVKGGDGGKSTAESTDGGAGALVTAYVNIGNGTGEVPAGSTLRLIPGQAGGSKNKFGGGGGGTAVAFKGPDGADTWQLLVVAGAGGGAGQKRSGRPGTVSTDGSNGLYGTGTQLDDGAGTDGEGAEITETGGYGGGGANTGGRDLVDHGSDNCSGMAGLQNSVPIGGSGGGGQCNLDAADIHGGFGFGGGGSGKKYDGGYEYLYAGGGGGGYSGGGGGVRDGGGGGGGSYVNPDLVSTSWIDGFGTTANPEDGFVAYRFINGPIIRSVHLAKDQTKCLDLRQAKTTNGSNIQLYSCMAGRIGQPWIPDGSRLRLSIYPAKCLDLDHSNTGNGTNIQLWDCNGTTAQQWIYDVLNQSIRSSVNYDKCLDLKQGNTANLTNIQLFDCNYTDDQKWIIDGVPAALPSGTNKQIHLFKAPDKCLDISNYNIANGTNIQLTACKDHPAQYFTFDGRRIRVQSAPYKCVDVLTEIPDKGKGILLMDCNGADAQDWIYDGFARAIRSAADPGMCLDVVESKFTNGTNIQLWPCNGTYAQQFVIY